MCIALHVCPLPALVSGCATTPIPARNLCHPSPTHRLHKASVAKFKHLWAFPSWSRYAPGPATQTLPPSNLTNTVKYDRLGRARSAVANAPGAYVKE